MEDDESKLKSFHKNIEKTHFFKSKDPYVVHVIAHSHDDVGWLKTVDEYYNGEKDYI